MDEYEEQLRKRAEMEQGLAREAPTLARMEQERLDKELAEERERRLARGEESSSWLGPGEYYGGGYTW